MADFNFYVNRQGVRGPQGIQGPQGFSPIITEYTNTLSEYVLQIQTQNNTFLTANLREHKDDLGGTYIRYNRETGVMYAGDADIASQSQAGIVRFATTEDIGREDETSVVSPANVVDMIAASDVARDVSNLQTQVGTNTDNITILQGQMTGLLADYVPKSRTINGKALSSNVTLTASDVGALPSTTPIPSKTSDLTNDSGFITSASLPDMTNYYTKSQTNTLLDGKANISNVPTKTSDLTNDSGFITSSDLPIVGNGTITFTQGGVSKGTFTVNQSGDTTVALDAGSQYVLPAATTSTLGGVIADGTTITVDSDGTIHSVGGGGGTSYNAGSGINIANNTISVDFDSTKGLAATNNALGVRVDGTTIDFDSSGNLKSLVQAPTYSEGTGIDITSGVISVDFTDVATASQGSKADTAIQPSDLATVATTGDYTDLLNKPTIPDVTHMVTDNTAQSITGNKAFVNDTLRVQNGNNYAVLGQISQNTYHLWNNSSSSIINPLLFGETSGNNLLNNNTYKLVYNSTDQEYQASKILSVADVGTGLSIDTNGNLINTNPTAYSLPTASNSTLGGVKIDGITITIDNNGVISSSGSGSSYTAGTGIDITSNVISIDDDVLNDIDDLNESVYVTISPTTTYNITEVGALTNTDGVLSGFSEDNYATVTAPITTAENNLEIIMKVAQTSRTDGNTILFTSKDRPVGFNAAGYLGMYTGRWTMGSVAYNNNGRYVWVKITSTNGSTYSMYGMYDNDYDIDSLPNNWDTVFENMAVGETNVFYNLNLELGTNAAVRWQYFHGNIDLNGCRITNNGNIVWEGVTATPGTLDKTQTNFYTKDEFVDANSIMAEMAMPSDTTENLTIGASFSTYTAPANGYYIFNLVTTSSNSSAYGLFNNTAGLASITTLAINNAQLCVFIPARKGDEIGIVYDAAIDSTSKLTFTYAKGSESEAS